MATDELPAWSLAGTASDTFRVPWPAPVTREAAWGGSAGEGVRVCIVDSGVDPTHPRVGELARSVVMELDEDGSARAVDDDAGDVAGHGTACAAIVRELAPACELASVRVLGEQLTGSGGKLLAGLAWAVEQGFDVINLSLSTRKRAFVDELRDLADRAYFGRALIVASAHNMAVQSFPWRFSSVVSVGTHDAPDPLEFHYNATPPVEFFARGVDVEVAWLGGSTITATGNSFATPHISGLCARILGKHPGLTPFQVKSLLCLTATNVDAGGR